MAARNPDKLRKLLIQGRLKRRAADLATRWSANGVSVSIVAPARYWKLIDRLGSGRSWPLKCVDNVGEQVRAFIDAADVVTIMGWDVANEPALLVSSQGLLRAIPSIDAIYPDGFVLINDETQSALLADIDEEEGVHACIIDLPT